MARLTLVGLVARDGAAEKTGQRGRGKRGGVTDYLTGQEEQRYFGGCCEHTAQVFSSFCAAFLGILYAMKRVEYFDGHSYFIIVIREMRSPNLLFFFLGDISLEFARQCVKIFGAVFYPLPPQPHSILPFASMPDTAAAPPDMYPRGINPRLRYIKSYWWPYKTFVKQRYAPALSTPTAPLTLIYKDGSDASSSKLSPQSSEIAPWNTM